MHPIFMKDVVVAESKIHGIGVFAMSDYAEGEIILPIDDSRVVDDEHPLRPALGEHSYHCDYPRVAKLCSCGRRNVTLTHIAIRTVT